MAQLILDFLPILLFFIAFKAKGIFFATGVLIVATAVQMAIIYFKHGKLTRMQWISLLAIVLFGGVTLALRDRQFLMLKVTVIQWLFAAAFAVSPMFTRGKPLIESMLDGQLKMPRPAWQQLNWLWVGFFVVSGALNLAMAARYISAENALKSAYPPVTTDQIAELDCSAPPLSQVAEQCERASLLEDQWARFKTFGLLVLTIVFVALQTWFIFRNAEELPDATDPPEQPKPGQPEARQSDQAQ